MGATLEPRRKVPPGGEHEHGKRGVDNDEHPGRRTVVEQLLEPVIDEAAAIRRLAGLRTQGHFQRGKGTNETQPGLADYDRDSRQVGRPEPEIVYPVPVFAIAYDDKRQSADNECSNAGVDDQHGIREQQAERRIEQHELPVVRVRLRHLCGQPSTRLRRWRRYPVRG